MSDKELVTVTLTIDLDVVVSAESFEEAIKLAKKYWMRYAENATVNARPRPFSEFDLDTISEDEFPIGCNIAIKDLIKRGR